MALNQFTNLNFEDIKTSITDYLRQNSDFSDFDFEGSNLSVLINTLAYNTYITAYNTNMVVNESFIDSATLRENVVSLARNVGYVPRSRRASHATCTINIVGLSTSTLKNVSIEPGVVASSNVNDTNFLFSLPEKSNFPVIEGEVNGVIEVYQGEFLSKEWTVNQSLPNQRFILPNDGIDTATIRVSVKENANSTTQTKYRLADNIVGVTSESNIFLIQETTDEKYELLFGDGIFGRKLESGNVVSASYIKTSGKDGNGCVDFNFIGRVVDQDDALLSRYDTNLTPNGASENGDDIESVESVKYFAPRLFSSQYRAVTANDYEAILPSLYPNIESITAYGGEELNPPQFGRVFIAAKPRNGITLSDYTKNKLLESLKNYSVAGIVPGFVDLKFLYIEIDSHIYYNSNFTGDPENIRTNVISALTDYSKSSEINQFGGRFKYSRAQAVIDNVDNAIVSNITHVRMRRDLAIEDNVFAQYELCFDNPFYAKSPRFNIKSTGFKVQGIKETVYLTDSLIPTEVVQQVANEGPLATSQQLVDGPTEGNLFLFKFDSTGNIVILSKTFGSVNYKRGEVFIDTVNITSTSLPGNIIEIQAIPLSNDVLGRKELYLQLDIAKSNFFMKSDIVTSGENTSGTRFQPQSSYQNGKKTR